MPEKTYWLHRTTVSPMFLNLSYKENGLPVLLSYADYCKYSTDKQYRNAYFEPLPHDFWLTETDDNAAYIKILQENGVGREEYLSLRQQNYESQLQSYFENGLYIQRQLLDTTLTRLDLEEQDPEKNLQKILSKQGMGFTTTGELSGLSNRNLLNVAIVVEIPTECLQGRLPEPVFEKAKTPREIATTYFQLQVMDKVIPRQFIKKAIVVSGHDRLSYGNPNFDENYHVQNGLHDLDVIETTVKKACEKYDFQTLKDTFLLLEHGYLSTKHLSYIYPMEQLRDLLKTHARTPEEKTLLENITKTAYAARRNSRTIVETQRDNIREIDVSKLSVDEVAATLSQFLDVSQKQLRELYKKGSGSAKFLDALQAFEDGLRAVSPAIYKKLEASISFNDLYGEIESLKKVADRMSEQRKTWEENYIDSLGAEEQSIIERTSTAIKSSDNSMTFLHYAMVADKKVRDNILKFLDKHDMSKFNDETNDGLDMSKYSKLLEKSIESIMQVKEQSDISALFKQGSAVLSGAKIKGLDDFELLAFVVVK